ncbi:MAG: LytTR family DNA-binding domain-containing protein [Bacteroidota bacterium]
MKFFNFIFLVFYCCIGFSQTDDPTIDTLIQKGNVFNYKNQDSALFYYKKSYETSLAKKDTFLIAATGYYYSFSLITSNRFEEAQPLINFNVSEAKNLPDVLIGNTYYNWGSIAYLQESYDIAIERFMIAEDYYKSAQNKRGLARSQLQLSVIYNKLGNPEMENYFADLSSTVLGSGAHSTPRMSTSEKIIALEQQLSATENISDKLKAILYHNLGVAQFDKSEWEAAITSFNKGLLLKEKVGFTNLKAEAKVYVAEAELYLGNSNKALQIVEDLPKDEKRKLPLRTELIFTEAYKALGNYKEALYHNEQLAFYQDSLNSIGENIKISEITAQYNTKEQKKQILAIQEENESAFLTINSQRKRQLVILLIAFLLLLTTLWFIRRWKSSEKQIALVKELKDEMEQKVEAQHLLLKSKSKIYLGDLQFVKSEGNYVEFHSVSKKTLEREKLKEILEKLPPNFIRVHRSYIVNKNEIDSYNSTTVFMKSGQEIPLSRTYKSNL